MIANKRIKTRKICHLDVALKVAEKGKLFQTNDIEVLMKDLTK